MQQLTDEEAKGKIVDKLVMDKSVGARYENIHFIKSLFPTHLLGKAYDLVKDLIKRGILIPHKGGECISINPLALPEAKRLRELFLTRKFKRPF